MPFEEESRCMTSEYRGDYSVVCFDCQTPHEMTFPDGMQAEAFAAVMTRHAKPCPICGGTTWSALGDIGDAINGKHSRMVEILSS